MDNEKLISEWQNNILSECEKRLSRNLSLEEERFIKSRSSFIALEIIEDTVLSMEETQLIDYLNSESDV